MVTYDIGAGAEAFSTHRSDTLGFDVTLPLHQAHSTRVRMVPEEAGDITGVDALITNRRGMRIGVKTADCVPVLLHDPAVRAAGAAHSGWKGTLGNIVGRTVTRMCDKYGSRPADIIAVIGPCIHQEAFEVGDEVYDAFCAAGYGAFCRMMPAFGTDSGVKWHIDLPGICRAQLLACGVGSIELRAECTYTLHDLFYSARRLGRNLGSHRMLSCIKLL